MPESPKTFLKHHAPKARRERWVFTNHELNTPAVCNRNDPFVAFPHDEEDRPIAAKGIVVKRTGEATGRWGDGTFGVPSDLQEFVDGFCEAYYKPTYFGNNFAQNDEDEFADNWRDVLAKTDGSFFGWAPNSAEHIIDQEV